MTLGTDHDGNQRTITSADTSWGGGRYGNTDPYFDAWDNVDPHPKSSLGNGLDEAWKAIGRPITTAVGMYYGAGALNGMMGATGAAVPAAGVSDATAAALIQEGAAATAGAGLTPSASGLAGALGMNAGYGATALNTGALNAGMSLARGKNIGDSLKTGITSAALSPIAGYVGDAAGGGYAGALAGSTALGGVQGAINGQGVGRGLQTGLVNGLVSSAGRYAGGLAKDATDSNFAGTAANSLTQSTLRGKDPSATIDSLATQYAAGQLTDLTDLPPQVAQIIVNLAKNKKPTALGALTAVTNAAVGSKQLKRAAAGA
jgi:hypothetical protein